MFSWLLGTFPTSAHGHSVECLGRKQICSFLHLCKFLFTQQVVVELRLYCVSVLKRSLWRSVSPVVDVFHGYHKHGDHRDFREQMTRWNLPHDVTGSIEKYDRRTTFHMEDGDAYFKSIVRIAKRTLFFEIFMCHIFLCCPLSNCLVPNLEENVERSVVVLLKVK
ncbi:unnamed protein product [Trypanosoma congolense IL3000]|uniref:WGS project CAEQ00000000 data, annotated contig 1790 n=1 Tax=Trypanosoma congolense (strain IL3000) TaxID=1068625 RepID=F9W8W8_TRYCI|nr:unnamed protein product [Trypanosoma congolense IL3000]